MLVCFLVAALAMLAARGVSLESGGDWLYRWIAAVVHQSDIMLRPGAHGRCLFHSDVSARKDTIGHQDIYLFTNLMGGHVSDCRKLERGEQFVEWKRSVLRSTCASSSADCETYDSLEETSLPSEGQLCDCIAPSLQAEGELNPVYPYAESFLEIGASDGQYSSNTLFFESQMGWRGICVEASPEAFQKLQRNRKLCANVNVAVAAAGVNTTTIFSFSSNSSLGSPLSQTIQGSQGRAAAAAHAAAFAKSRSLRVSPKTISAVTSEELFERTREALEAKLLTSRMNIESLFGSRSATGVHSMSQISGLPSTMLHLAYLSVDIESAELVFFQTLNFRKVRPRYISYEQGGNDCLVIQMLKTVTTSFFESNLRCWRLHYLLERKGYRKLTRLGHDLLYHDATQNAQKSNACT